MSRRGYLLLAAGLVAVAAASVVVATRVSPSHLAGGDADVTGSPVRNGAPALRPRAWLNTRPLSRSDVAGKVVVYDFWTYSCVNCVRTLPHLRAWYDRYARDGLVVVGVHSPEFTFEKDHANVAAAVRKLGVTWPVALDDDHHIWDQFANQYWPAKYVFDRSNHLRFVHFGEGDYGHTEDVLRRLLGIDSHASRAGAPRSSAGLPGVQQTLTQETYLGAQEGAGAFASPQALVAGEHDFTAPDPLLPNRTALAGHWLVDAEYVQSTASGDAELLSYSAREANLVLAPGQPGTAVDVVVELDGHPVPAGERGRDVGVDGQGRTVVHVTSSDLYRLVLAPKLESHVLRLTPEAPGVRMYAYTFG